MSVADALREAAHARDNLDHAKQQLLTAERALEAAVLLVAGREHPPTADDDSVEVFVGGFLVTLYGRDEKKEATAVDFRKVYVG